MKIFESVALQHFQKSSWLVCSVTDVTWNSDDESLVASTTGQPRGDCPYSNNLDFCRGCTTGQALDLDDRRNSILVTSIEIKNQTQ